MKKRQSAQCVVQLFAGLFLIFQLLSCSTSSHLVKQSKPVENGLQNMGNGICLQHSSGMMWQIDTGRKVTTVNEASQRAAQLELGGFDDWRLPTKEECYALGELLIMKKGDCPIKIERSYCLDERKERAGHWEEYPLCGGPELRWVEDFRAPVRAVRP